MAVRELSQSVVIAFQRPRGASVISYSAPMAMSRYDGVPAMC